MSDITNVPGLVLPVNFVCTDAEGIEHQYQCHQFNPTDGEKILWELISLIGPASGSLIVSLMMGGKSADDILDGSIDPGALGTELTSALRKGNMPGLRRAILAKTFRDGAKLNESTVFDSAYRANYAELLRAQWEVLRANNLFLGLATFLSSAVPAGAQGPSGLSPEKPAAEA